ncbi:lytic murein transglycosylase [Emcibacter sp. SYSU 3D8]|uniref:lytic murein transglycosylase n=1 Tax=Emcibacter sp. SYSU 3D8 TaxID=3133969 RepID=UPI0031FEDAC5
MRLLLVLALLLLPVTLIPAAAAQDGQPKWEDWLKEVRKEAEEKGIRAEILDQTLTGLTPLERVIRADQNQAEFVETLDTYLAKRVSQARIDGGRKALAENADLLRQVAEKHGVQPEYIVAIWGMETNYGKYFPSENAIQALATLAYDPRRGAYFRKELFAALEILNDDFISVPEMKASWAGAMGQPQFMPTSYLQYADDFDGDGHKDIWNNKGDIFGSVANYLRSYKWQGEQPWGFEVSLPEGFAAKLHAVGDYDQGGCRAMNQHSRALPLSEWQSMGVRDLEGRDLPPGDMEATLIKPDGEASRAFLAFGNYRAILRYNCANFYAIAVGRLADLVKQ